MIEPPEKRVSAFIDGQNLYHHVKDAFGYTYPNYDVKALAQAVCREQEAWHPGSVHFYTGIPDERHNPEGKKIWDSRLLRMKRQGVKTHARPLKYQTKVLENGDKTIIVQEKGIDIRIALDIIRGAIKGEFDIALLFSQDQDFVAVAEAIREIAREKDSWIHIACAYPRSGNATARRGINKTDWLPFDQSLYNQCIDPRDYRPRSK